MPPKDEIVISKANVHNLKNVSVKIPKNTFTVITGPSGSGKSSLAFDTIYVEGKRRYIESLSSYARQFLGQLQPPDVESINTPILASTKFFNLLSVDALAANLATSLSSVSLAGIFNDKPFLFII